MKKQNYNILLILILTIFSLVLGFFISAVLNQMLTAGAVDMIQLAPTLIFESILNNRKHGMLTVGITIIILCVVLYILLVNRRQTFMSETKQITANIETPIAIGQGQHGTAKWLSDKDKDKIFATYYLHSKTNMFEILFEAGKKDIKAVNDKSAKRITGKKDNKNIEPVPENKAEET